LAPEQLQAKLYCPETDAYQLGVLVYTLLTRKDFVEDRRERSIIRFINGYNEASCDEKIRDVKTACPQVPSDVLEVLRNLLDPNFLKRNLASCILVFSYYANKKKFI